MSTAARPRRSGWFLTRGSYPILEWELILGNRAPTFESDRRPTRLLGGGASDEYELIARLRCGGIGACAPAQDKELSHCGTDYPRSIQQRHGSASLCAMRDQRRAGGRRLLPPRA